MYSNNKEIVVDTNHRYYNTISNIVDITGESGLSFTFEETLKQYMWQGISKVYFDVRNKFYEEIAPFRLSTIMVLIYTVDYKSDCSFHYDDV